MDFHHRFMTCPSYQKKASISACFPCSAAFYQCRTVTHCLLCVASLLQKAFATCFYISDSQHFERRFTPPKCVLCLSRVPRSDRVPTNKKDTRLSVFFIQRLSILPGRFQPSTFDVCELNYRVRHGYGCILTAIATVSESVLSKLYRRIFHLRFLKVF